MKKILLIAAGLTLVSSVAAQTSDVSPQIVSQVQTSLSALGYSPGPSDGRLTPQTTSALMQLQRSRNLPATGSINEPTLSALGIGSTQNAIVAPGTSTVPNAVVSVAPNTVQAQPNATFTPTTPVPSPSAGMPGTASPGTAPPGTNSLGGTTPGAPSPSFGATPAGAPSASFTATPPGAPSAAFGTTAATTSGGRSGR